MGGNPPRAAPRLATPLGTTLTRTTVADLADPMGFAAQGHQSGEPDDLDAELARLLKEEAEANPRCPRHRPRTSPHRRRWRRAGSRQERGGLRDPVAATRWWNDAEWLGSNRCDSRGRGRSRRPIPACCATRRESIAPVAFVQDPHRRFWFDQRTQNWQRPSAQPGTANSAGAVVNSSSSTGPLRFDSVRGTARPAVAEVRVPGRGHPRGHQGHQASALPEDGQRTRTPRAAPHLQISNLRHDQENNRAIRQSGRTLPNRPRSDTP